MTALVKAVSTVAERAEDVNSGEVRARLRKLLTGPGHPQVRLAALAGLARTGGEPLPADQVSLAAQLLSEIHAELRPSPPSPTDEHPATLVGVLRQRQELVRQQEGYADEGFDPFGPKPVRELSWALGDQVDARIRCSPNYSTQSIFRTGSTPIWPYVTSSGAGEVGTKGWQYASARTRSIPTHAWPRAR